jgi:polar amino acid transport system substrate-binding protein
MTQSKFGYIATYARSLSRMFLALLALLPFGIGMAHADKLQEILSRRELVVGVVNDAPPFGFVDKSGNLVGMDIDLANMIAKEMDVKVRFEIVPIPARIPTLLTGKVDMLIAVMGSTPQRALQVMYSNPYVVIDLGVYAADKVNPITDRADLKKLKISVGKGTTSDVWLSENVPGIQLVRFEDAPSAIAAFMSGQTDAFAEGSNLASTVIKNSGRNDIKMKFSMRQSPVHIAVKHGEFNLKNWIDTMLFTKRIDGNLQQLHIKWFGQVTDIPPM